MLIIVVKLDAKERSYNKLKWKNGRDIGEDNREVVLSVLYGQKKEKQP